MKIYRTKNVSLNGITIEQYHAAISVLSKKMFDLFDSTGNTYNSNRGNSLMWVLSFTANVISGDICNTYKGGNLSNHILSKLIENAQSLQSKSDLTLLKA